MWHIEGAPRLAQGNPGTSCSQWGLLTPPGVFTAPSEAGLSPRASWPRVDEPCSLQTQGRRAYVAIILSLLVFFFFLAVYIWKENSEKGLEGKWRSMWTRQLCSPSQMTGPHELFTVGDPETSARGLQGRVSHQKGHLIMSPATFQNSTDLSHLCKRQTLIPACVSKQEQSNLFCSHWEHK